MKIYCLEEFKDQFDRLMTKNSYRTLEREIIDYFFGKTAGQLRSGVNLNRNIQAPYIKKRLKGRGGFRLYFLIVIKADSLYLIFVHPKAGPLGASNITDESKNYLYKRAYSSIRENRLYKVLADDEGESLSFEKLW